MMSSLSFLYLRSCDGESSVVLQPVARRPGPAGGAASCTRRRWRRRSRARFGFSSASMAESDTLFSMSSSSIVRRRSRPPVGLGAARLPRRLVRSPGDRRRRVLAVGAGIGRFEIDDVAQQDLAVAQFVAPDDDGLEGQRAFAQARRSSPRGRPRCAWRWRFRPRGTAARPSPSRADTSAPDRRCGRSAPLRLVSVGSVCARRPRRVAALGLVVVGRGLLAAGALLACRFGLLVVDDVDAHLAEHGRACPRSAPR